MVQLNRNSPDMAASIMENTVVMKVDGNSEEVHGENTDPAIEGLEETLTDDDCDEEHVELSEEETDGINEDESADSEYVQGAEVDFLDDIGNIDIISLTDDDVKRFSFQDLGAAFLFYSWYGKIRGFGARKSNLVRNSRGDVVEQTFVCSRQGYRQHKYLNNPNRRREPRALTRCGCEAKMRVRVMPQSGRWCVTLFTNAHNHELLPDKFVGMLACHRKVQESDILQLNNMREAGISTADIYGSFAKHSGGFREVGFNTRDLHNQLRKQRQVEGSDARAALSYLKELRRSDPGMFWKYTVDTEDRLQHLFWCDGISQLDYEIFGDVLAFDAAYQRNKYMLPFVVFSGVNNHNQTIVFGSALIANETEETYVWLLEQFLHSMKGRCPSSVITDGDVAMRNAIASVFPNAHHRLCAWHLLRNATSNVGNPSFTSDLKKCMLSDYELQKFQRMWEAMLVKYGVENHMWVLDLYEKRHMWATAHIRGNFFAGFRTTSRCESLNARLRRFLHCRMNVTEFLKQFNRCINYMRFREVELEFKSAYGEPVLQTPLKGLERSAAKVFTVEVFHLFRPVLVRACRMKVVGCNETASCRIYVVTKSCDAEMQWYVSFYPQNVELKCSCMRMESLGIPCEHLVAVMVYVDIDELPHTLVLGRWSKCAKELVEVRAGINSVNVGGNGTLLSCYCCLLDICRLLCTLACRTIDDFYEIREKLSHEVQLLQQKTGRLLLQNDYGDNSEHLTVKDPARVRCKGRPSTSGSKRRRVIHCRNCGQEGHNRKTCCVLGTSNATLRGNSAASLDAEYEDGSEHDESGTSSSDSSNYSDLSEIDAISPISLSYSGYYSEIHPGLISYRTLE